MSWHCRAVVKINTSKNKVLMDGAKEKQVGRSTLHREEVEKKKKPPRKAQVLFIPYCFCPREIWRLKPEQSKSIPHCAEGRAVCGHTGKLLGVGGLETVVKTEVMKE